MRLAVAVNRAVPTRFTLQPGRRPPLPAPCRSRAVTMQRDPDRPVSTRHQPSPNFPATIADLPAKVASRFGFLVSAS